MQSCNRSISADSPVRGHHLNHTQNTVSCSESLSLAMAPVVAVPVSYSPWLPAGYEGLTIQHASCCHLHTLPDHLPAVVSLCLCVCVFLQSSLAVTVDPVDRAMRVRAGVVFPGPDWRVDTYDRVTKEVELVQVRAPHTCALLNMSLRTSLTKNRRCQLSQHVAVDS